MLRVLRFCLLLVLLGASTLAAGCSRTIGSPETDASSSATPSMSVQETGGQVTVTLDKAEYAPGDTIATTIHNGLSQTIWVEDHQTGCKIVLAEYLQAGRWQAIQNCRLMTPTRMVPLAAGSTTSAGLSTSQDFIADNTGWPPGAYRVTLTYSGSDKGTGEPSGVVHSAQFIVR
jgi:hypothetical protein